MKLKTIKKNFKLTVRSFCDNINYSKIKSLLFVPGNQEKMLKKSFNINANVISPDLEDSVPISEKSNARKLIIKYLSNMRENPKSLIMPRLNSITSEFFESEFEDFLSKNNFSISINGFVIPKVNTPEEYTYIHKKLIKKEEELGLSVSSLKLIIWIETTLGLVNIKEIFRLNHKLNNRLIAACFGAEDYCNDLGIERSHNLKEIEYARSIFAMNCKAYKILAIDTPNVNYTDSESLIDEINYVKSLGFKGKYAIHPSQVEIINKHFLPNMSEVLWAQKIVEEYEKGIKEGKGAISVDNKMVDVPVYKRALNILKCVSDT